MIDQIIRAGANFDLLTSLLALVHRVVFRAVGYNVPEDCGVSAYSIRDLLKSYGVKSRNWQILGWTVGGSVMTFTVARGAAWTTQAVLDAYSIPYTGGRTFKRTPFLPQQAGPGGAAAATPTVPTMPTALTFTDKAAAQLAERRARKGR